MTATEILYEITEKLENAAIEDAKFEAEQIVTSVCDISLSQLLLNGAEEISAKKQDKIFAVTEKRCEHYPLQYLLGEWEFYSLPFKINEGVLIPRPDTEILVDTALDYIADSENMDIADLCSGSGCIAIAVEKNAPENRVTAYEKYDAAYKCLCENIKLNNSQAEAVCYDIADGPDKHFDMILSNPPYIKSRDIPSLQKEVGFEPTTALDGGEDGLKFYRIICDKWVPYLKDGGVLITEIGYDQKADVIKIFENANLTCVECKTDYEGNDRVVIGTKNSVINRKD